VRLPWRRRWTIAIVGKLSGHRTSLEGIYKFRRFSDALEKAVELETISPNRSVVAYEPLERR
jgi:hypothetical protein